MGSYLDAGPWRFLADGRRAAEEGREAESRRDAADAEREEVRVVAAEAGREDGRMTVSRKRSETAVRTWERRSRRAAVEAGVSPSLLESLFSDATASMRRSARKSLYPHSCSAGRIIRRGLMCPSLREQ